ncbi:MAG: hypothetical protein IT159_10145 [Bryobacterales bacterium]|nr:hypothetical protein [Bryobacterales bacterium]
MKRWVSRPAVIALVAVLAVFAWQSLTVHFNYGGNWTALFCTGARLQAPPQLDWEGIYRFPASDGYDGQFYHYLAHDPFLRKGFDGYMDDARLRYRRILVPAAAYLLAAGQDRYVDTAVFAVLWLSVLLGAYWLSRLAELSGRNPAWGLGFLLVPATIVSVDRMVVDATLAALTAGFAYYSSRGGGWGLYLLLTCACLTRETGFLLLAAYLFSLLWRRRLRMAGLFATSAVPALAWSWHVASLTRPDLLGKLASQSPMGYLRFRAWRTPDYSFPDLISLALKALDYLLLAAIALAIVLAVRSALKPSRDPRGFAALAFAVFMIAAGINFTLLDPFTFPRIASPLLLLVGMESLGGGWRFSWAPLAAVALRTCAQLVPQALGILRGLIGQ